MNMRRWITILFLVCFAGSLANKSAWAAGLQAPLADPIGLTGTTTYTQNFDSLASTGTSSTVPPGWEFYESGTAANTTYTAGYGSSATGDTYSFGATGTSERAFGGLLSGSLVPTFGASFTNSTGGSITQVDISYTGEEWRLGATGRADRLDFQYSLNATSLTSGTWVDVNSFDFSTPTTTGTTGEKDGNALGYRTSISGAITGLSIPSGATFYIRWTDFNPSGADDGLAVDDFSLSVTFTPPSDTAPTVTSTTPANGATNITTNATIDVNFSESVDLAASAVTLTCNSSPITLDTLPANDVTSITLTPASALPAGAACTGSVVANAVTDNDGTATQMENNYTWGFSVIADNPPTVTSVTPANGATDVATNAALSVNFSESVDLAAGAVTLSCDSTSIALNTLPSNDVTNITLTPASAMPSGASCNATIVASAVTDNDGTSDTMASDYAWSFTVVVSATPADIVISQVYGGGGNNGATYTHDFIELFNRGTITVDLTGWSVQYASATGSSWQATPLNGSIAPGQYYLIREAAGGGGTTPLPTPDAIGTIAMGAANGKVALVNTATALSGPCPTGSSIFDRIGYGTATCYEGTSAAPGIGDATADRRANGGCTDTNQNGSDFSTGAPTPRNNPYPAHSCTGDDAPGVTSTTPANGASNVAVNANIVVNFNEAVNVSGTWFDITCTSSGSHAASISGTNPATSFIFDPTADFSNGETCTLTIYAAQVSDDDTTDPPDNMTANYVGTFSTVGAPLPCSTIPLIQGTGNVTSCAGHRSNIQGCITGVTATGFYFQDVSGDGNPASSDGIFAYFYSTWENPSNLQPGQLVSVNGEVSEYYNTTEFVHRSADPLTASVIGSCTLPAAVSVSPIADPTADPMTLYEPYEGMRVQMNFNGWVVGPTKRFDSRYTFGDPEIAFVNSTSSIPAGSRIFQSDFPGYQGINYLSGGLNYDLPNLDFGDTVAGSNITGVLGYQFDKYTLLVDTNPSLTAVDNPDVSSPQTAADTARREFDICYYNVENLFDNINDGQGDWGDWAPGWPTANTPEGAAAYQAHVSETAAVLFNSAQSCMVIGLEEMEGKQAVYDNLAATLSGLDAAYNWTAIYVESGDSRDISQGFLYRDDITLVSGPTPVSGAPYTAWVSDSSLDFRRVPASARFRFFAGTGVPVEVTVYGLHFKSKGSSSGCTTDDCTDVRELEAADLRDILAHHQTADEFAIAGGDFNDFIGSSPIGILDASPNIYGLFGDLPANQRYSYIFSGESEVLDYIYLTRNMLTANGFGWERAFSPIHVNADFPASEHASDHDPVRVRFLGSDLSDLPTSYGQAWHTLPHRAWLGSNVTNDAAFAVANDNSSDDGVFRLSGLWQPGSNVTLRVTVSGSGPAWFTGWFDWNLDGDLNDTGEKTINQAVSIGTNDIPFTIPNDAQVGIGSSVSLPSRFRLYESATEPLMRASEIIGGAIGGEVEDFNWSFGPTAIELTSLQAAPHLKAWAGLLAFLLLLTSGFAHQLSRTSQTS